MKQSSWKEGYTKEELEKIAGPLGYTVGSVAFSPLAAGLGAPATLGINKGIDEAIIDSRPSKEEEQIMKSDPGFWTGTKAGITSIVPTLAGSLAGYGVERAISDDSSGMYGALAGAAAAGIPSSYYLGKYFGKEDALTARAKTYSTVKQSSWKEGYTEEELYKIAFDMDSLVENLKGQTEIDDEETKKKIIDAAKKAQEYVEEKAKPDPELEKLIVNGAKKINDELFPPWYKDPKNLPIAVGGAATAGALGVTAMALNKDKRTDKKASWANYYTEEELYKIAACAKLEKDAEIGAGINGKNIPIATNSQNKINRKPASITQNWQTLKDENFQKNITGVLKMRA